MTFYPPNVGEKFRAPKNAGRASGANAVGTDAAFVCGAVLRLTLRIDAASKEILEAKFQTDGCGFSIAAAQSLTEKIVGKKLVEPHGLDESVLRAEIENALGEFEKNRSHCLNLALKTLQNALADFRARQIEEFTGETALICTCFGVPENTIEKVIAENALQSVEEVTEICRAGGGCGSCQPLIQEILDVYWRENI